MSWHDDRQRRLDSEEQREIKAQDKANRQKLAKKLYEDGVCQEEIARRAHCGGSTLTQWIREGGWKRSEG